MNQQKNQSPSHNSAKVIGDVVLIGLFFSSLLLMYFGIKLYRITVIQPRHIALQVLLSGFLFGVLLTLFKTSWSKSWMFIEGFFGGACVAFFITLYVNRQFNDGILKSERFPVLKTGTLAKGSRRTCGSPFATIDFHGVEKDLVFTCDFEKSLKRYSAIEVTYYTGKLGFEVIISKIPKP